MRGKQFTQLISDVRAELRRNNDPGVRAADLPSIQQAVNRAYETTLSEGVLFERRVFHSMFALEDQKEGMAAFVEKRKPVFKNR